MFDLVCEGSAAMGLLEYEMYPSARVSINLKLGGILGYVSYEICIELVTNMCISPDLYAEYTNMVVLTQHKVRIRQEKPLKLINPLLSTM